MQDLTALACGDFLSALAGPAAAPGGGGVSALAGALGVALGNMVGSLTVGKPKYAAVEPEDPGAECAGGISALPAGSVVSRQMQRRLRRWLLRTGCPGLPQSRRRKRRRPWKLPWRERVQCRCRSWSYLPRALPWQSNTPPKAVCWRYRMQGVQPFCARPRCAAAC